MARIKQSVNKRITRPHSHLKMHESKQGDDAMRP